MSKPQSALHGRDQPEVCDVSDGSRAASAAVSMARSESARHREARLMHEAEADAHAEALVDVEEELRHTQLAIESHLIEATPLGGALAEGSERGLDYEATMQSVGAAATHTISYAGNRSPDTVWLIGLAVSGGPRPHMPRCRRLQPRQKHKSRPQWCRDPASSAGAASNGHCGLARRHGLARLCA